MTVLGFLCCMDDIHLLHLNIPSILIQVMKMIMTLEVEESGHLCYVKRPGALLEAGCVIARLELDDPTKVHPVSIQGRTRLFTIYLLH